MAIVTPFVGTDDFSMATFNSRINQINTKILTDETKALFGLDSASGPDDVFAWIGKFNEYWWSLQHGQAYSYYKEVLTPRESTADITRATTIIYYSYSISISDTGVISLDSPQSIEKSGWLTKTSAQTLCNQLAELAVDAPYYMYTSKNTTIHKIPKGATAANTFDSYGYTFAWTKDSDNDAWVCYGTGTPASVVTTQIVNVEAGKTTYEHSTDRNAYPDSGTVDDITYAFLGKPFEKFPTIPKIATGSYVGTGTYGSDNPCSLTFDFVPRYFCVYAMSGTIRDYDSIIPIYANYDNYYTGIILDCSLVPLDFREPANDSTFGYGFGTYGYRNYQYDYYYTSISTKLVGKTLSWFAKTTKYETDELKYYSQDSASYMFNSSGVTYYWFAIE